MNFFSSILFLALSYAGIPSLCMEETPKEITIKHNDPIKYIKFSPDENYIFFTTENGDLGQKIEIYASKGEYIKTIKADSLTSPEFNKNSTGLKAGVL